MVDCFSCVFLHGQVVTAIVESGKNMSAEQKKTERCPLLYEWHKKQYIGAAHGMAGIYYMLMQVSCVLFGFYRYFLFEFSLSCKASNFLGIILVSIAILFDRRNWT